MSEKTTDRETWLVEDATIYVIGADGRNRCWANFQSMTNFAGAFEARKAKARQVALAANAHDALLAYAECQEAFDAYYHAANAGEAEEARLIEVFERHGIESRPTQPRRREALGVFRRAALAKATTARPAAPSGG